MFAKDNEFENLKAQNEAVEFAAEPRKIKSSSNEHSKKKEPQPVPDPQLVTSAPDTNTMANLNGHTNSNNNSTPKKGLDSFLMNEPKVTYTSISDLQKTRNVSKQPVNASRSNSTYYNNLNNKNAINNNNANTNGNTNYRLHKNSIDSNDQGSPLQLQAQQIQRTATNNEINSNFKTNAAFGLAEQIRRDEDASRLSHITRDVNDSYAYTNVQQYIEENELMPPDKAQSIRKWINKVNSWCDEWEKRTIELNIEDSV